MFVAALDRLVHAHLHVLYQHVRCVYPLADGDEIVDDVFTTAARQGLTPGPATQWQLLRLARSAVQLRFPATEWAQRNALAVVLSLRQTADLLDDWYTWNDIDPLLHAIESCPADDQEILGLTIFVEDLDPDRLAVILGTDPDTAEIMLQHATTTFRAALPDDGSRG